MMILNQNHFETKKTSKNNLKKINQRKFVFILTIFFLKKIKYLLLSYFDKYMQF